MSDIFNKLKQGIGQNMPKGLDSKAGLIGAAGVGGLLGALFGGSKGVQKTAKNVAIVGGSAALAALAYKMYQNWSNKGSAPNQAPQGGYGAPQGGYGAQQGGYGAQQGGYGAPQGGYGAPQGGAYGAPQGSAYGAQGGAYGAAGGANDDPFAQYNSANNDALLLANNDMGKLIIEAMVFAARADGHIDASEQQMIMSTAQQVSNDPNFNATIRECLSKPLDVRSLAAKVSGPDQANDIYRLSAAAIVADNPAEMQYLNDLAAALNLAPATRAALDNEAMQFRNALATTRQ